MKGGLVRDILYPKEFKFTFYSDSLKFVGIMAIITILGSIYTVYGLWKSNAVVVTYVDRLLNNVFIGVPPALPAAVGSGVAFAARRLKQCKISCISTPRINIAGRINHFVFDKTGTLTEDGLSVLGVRNASENTFRKFEEHSNALMPDDKWWKSPDV